MTRSSPLYPMRCCSLFAAIFLLGSTICQAQNDGLYQEDDDFDVLKVYVPSSQLKEILDLARDQKYPPTELDRLQLLLEARQQRRERGLLGQPALDAAIYVARLENDRLISELSCFQSSGKGLLKLGETSVALGRARGVGSDELQFVDELRMAAKGSMQIPVDGPTKHWLSFAQNRNAANDPRFQLKLPAAKQAFCFVVTRDDVSLQSDDVLVESIDSPLRFLPEDWPDRTSLARSGISTQRRWWMIYLGGKREFALETVGTDLEAKSSFRHLARKGFVEFKVSPNEISVAARFDILERDLLSPLRLKAASNLRISSLRLNGSPISWTTQVGSEPNTLFLELDAERVATLTARNVEAAPSISESADPQANSDTAANPREAVVLEREDVLELEAVKLVSEDADLGRMQLPQLAVSKCFVIDGVVQVKAAPQFTVLHANSESGEVLDLTQTASSSTETEGQLRYQMNWSGDVPKINVQLAENISNWEAEGLHRFSLNPRWLQAESILRVSSGKTQSNEVSIRVGERWVVDEVEVLDSETVSLATSIIEPAPDSEGPTIILVHWDDQRSDVNFQLSVKGHRGLQKESERIRRLLTLPNSNQVDNYVLKPSGRFRVDLTANLLMFQIQDVNLPVWQRELIDDAESQWIFQGVRRTIPPIRLVQEPARFSSKSAGWVSEIDNSALQITWVTELEPDNEVDSVLLQMPPVVDASQIDFRLGKGKEPLRFDVLQRDEESLLVRVLLTEPLSKRTLLQTSFRHSGAAVPLVTFPDATEKTITLFCTPSILAKIDFAGLPKGAIEFLPNIERGEHLSLESSERFMQENESNWVGLRIGEEMQSQLPLDSRNPTVAQTGWVVSEKIEHWLTSLEKAKHRVEWVVEPGESNLFQVRIPKDWRLSDASVGDRPLRLIAPEAILAISVEPRQKTRIVLYFDSRADSTGWITNLSFSRPTLQIPVVQRHARLLLPPSIALLKLHSTPDEDGVVVARLMPMNWWKSFTPGKTKEVASAPDEHFRWTSIPLDSSKATERLWLIKRTAYSCLAIAGTFALSAVLFVVLGGVLTRLWGCLTILAALVILSPGSWLVFAQTVFLASVLATVAAILRVVIKRRLRDGSNPASTRTKSLPQASAVTGSLLAGLFCLAAQVQALDTSNSNEKQVHVIFLPVDDSWEGVEGNLVYAPEVLLAKLQEGAKEEAEREAAVRDIDYVLRLLPSDDANEQLIEELTANVTVDIPAAAGQIRLEFLAESMPLLVSESEIDGTSVDAMDATLYQDDKGVVFKPEAPGPYRLKLRFQPEAKLEESGRAVFEAGIPPYPSAKLRVIADSKTRVEIPTVGSPKLETSARSLDLGPATQLKCSWISKSTSSQAVSTRTHLWMHGNSSHLCALAVIEVSNPSALPDVFRIAVDDNWEVVGSNWGDVSPMPTQRRQLQSNREFDVEFRDAADKFQNVATIRMLLSQRTSSRSMDTAQIVYPVVRNTTVLEKSLWWSSTEDSPWRAELSANWLPGIASDLNVWGKLAWTDLPQRFLLPTGVAQCSFKKQDQVEERTATEVNTIHLSSSEARIQYLAQWKETSKRPALRFRIPKSANVSSCKILGSNAPYRVIAGEAEDYLLIFSSLVEGEIASAELELTTPIRGGSTRSQTMSRVVMDDAAVSSSIVRVLRRAGVRCDFDLGDANDIRLEKVSLRPSDVLSNLEVLVGQAELEGDYRDSSQLPIQYRLLRLGLREDLQAILFVEPEGAQWRGRLVVRGPEYLSNDFLFLRVPSDLSDALSSKHDYQTVPSGDPLLATIAMLPLTESQTAYSFEMELDLEYSSVNNQVTIPPIDILSSQGVRPLIALPDLMDGSVIRWSADFLAEPLELNYWKTDELKGVTLAIGQDSDTVVTWQPEIEQSNQASLWAARWGVEQVQEEFVSQFVDFWIEPGGGTYVEFDLPTGVEVCGVTVGERFANYSFDTRRLRVLLQPNYGPVRLRIHFTSGTRRAGGWLLDAPQAIGLADEEIEFSFQCRDRGWEASGELSPVSNGMLIDTWTDLLSDSIDRMRRLPVSERIAWLEHWQPSAMGFGEQFLVSSLDQSDSANAKVLLEQFWAEICRRAGVKPDQLKASSVLYAAEQRQFKTELPMSLVKLQIELQPQLIPTRWGHKLSAAGIVVFLSASAYFLYRLLRRRLDSFLPSHPWSYWAMLGAVGFLLLPVQWPSYILWGCAVIMAAGQWLDSRRIAQFQ